MKRILVFSAAIAAAAAFALTGCSSSGPTNPPVSGSLTSTGTPTSTVHDKADVAFATDMIRHHAQAIEMADMAENQATNSTVTSLAAAIKKAQDPEIAKMSGWLRTWGQPIPSTSMSSTMGGMNMGGGTGMMSSTDMDTLGKATGATFDRMWVTMMITHHQGAVSMATTELSGGSNPDAKTLARSIIRSQNAQIQQMRTLLTQLPAK